MRDLEQDAGAVAGVRVAARRAAVGQVAEDLERAGDDLVRGLALRVATKPEAAGVVLEVGIVEALARRKRHRASFYDL